MAKKLARKKVPTKKSKMASKPKAPKVKPHGFQGALKSTKAPEPVGAYVHARRAGGLLFLAGIGPRRRGANYIPGVQLDAMGKVISYDVVAQTESVIANVRAVLEEAGSSFDKIVDVQVFLTNMKADFKAMNQVYEKYFKNIPATRTTVEVGALPTPIHVEFKVIAEG